MWFQGDESMSDCRILAVANITPSLAQWDIASDMDTYPALDVVFHRELDLPNDPHRSAWALLNKSGDRLLFRSASGDMCKLWELPSGELLATLDVTKIWTARVPPDATDTHHDPNYMILIQHPTESEWLICIDDRWREALYLLSWRDLTLSSCPEKTNAGGLSHEEEGDNLWTRQPAPPSRVPAILRGLGDFGT